MVMNDRRKDDWQWSNFSIVEYSNLLSSYTKDCDHATIEIHLWDLNALTDILISIVLILGNLLNYCLRLHFIYSKLKLT